MGGICARGGEGRVGWQEAGDDGSGRAGGGSSSNSRHNGACGSEVGAEAAYHGALALARSCEDVVAESAAGSGAPAAGRAAHGRNRSWPRAVGGRSSCVNLRPTGGDTKRVRVGQGGGDGGRRERAAWPRPSGLPPSSLTPSHNYPFPKPHNTQPTPSLLRVYTRSDHGMSTVVLLP